MTTLIPPPFVYPTAPADSARLTPIGGQDLFEPGMTFPRLDLPQRVLSVFWLDCCTHPGLSRMPAPAVELSGGRQPGVAPLRILAWWLMPDGIFMEAQGPGTARMQSYFGGPGQPRQRWPRYEFQIFAGPLQVEMSFYHEPGAFRGVRIILELGFYDRVRVIRQERWTKP